MLSRTTKAALVALALLLPIFVNAEIVRLEITVDSISHDMFGTGAQAGDTLGYMEYDNTGLVRCCVTEPGLTYFTVLTAFSFDFAGKQYGLEDLTVNQVWLDDDNFYENPYTFFRIETNDLVTYLLGATPNSYIFQGNVPNDTDMYFEMSISTTAVPIPAAAYLFASGLGLLGWFRRRQTA
jgi:hypothetical protein